jgi:hypothetical protein
MTDDPNLSAADVIRTCDKRWTIAQWGKDVKPLLGLGQYQNRSHGAAVTHLYLVAFAYALSTHLRSARTGAQGQRIRTGLLASRPLLFKTSSQSALGGPDHLPAREAPGSTCDPRAGAASCRLKNAKVSQHENSTCPL